MTEQNSPTDTTAESVAGDADAGSGSNDASNGTTDSSEPDSDDSESTGGEVPWTDFEDEPAGTSVPSPSAGTPTQVIAGTTAFLQPASYCEQCPCFDESAMACSNAATDILERLHDGRLHVANCPVVTADGPAFERVQRD